LRKSVYGPLANRYAMETFGLCNICSRPARHSCSLCGALFCDDHFDKTSGLCYNCALKVRMGEKRTDRDVSKLLK